MRTFKLLIFLAITFSVIATAQVYPVTNPQNMALSPDATQLYVGANNTLQTYAVNTLTSPFGLTLEGSIQFPSTFPNNPTATCATATKVVVQLYNYGVVGQPNLGVLDRATGLMTYSYLSNSGVPFEQGGCAPFADGTVLLGASSGGLAGEAKLALLNPSTDDVQYYDTTTEEAVVAIYAVPGTTKALVIYSYGARTNSSFALVDSTNMSVPVNLIPLGFEALGLPGFSPDGNIYLSGISTSGIGGSVIVNAASGIATQLGDNGWSSDRKFAGDSTYFYAVDTYTDMLIIVDPSTGKETAGYNTGNGPYTQMFVTRDADRNVDHFLLLGNNALVAYDLTGRPLPYINANGVLNGASFVSEPVASNEWLSIFGRNLANQVAYPSTAGTTKLGGTTATIQVSGGQPTQMVIAYAGPNQLNVLTPANLPIGVTATIKVTQAFSDGTSVSTSTQVTTANSAVAVFQWGSQAVIIHQDGTPSTSANPGEIVSLYGTGGGPVQPCNNGMMCTSSTPTITVNGIAAKVLFSGLCPAYAGLNQFNVQIPYGIQTGSQPLAIQIGSGPISLSKVLIAAPQGQ